MRVEARGLIYDATAKPDAERIAFFTSLCPLRSGVILCSFQVGPSKHAPTATLRLCRSGDGGTTWQELPYRFATALDGVPGSLAAGEMVETEPRQLLLLVLGHALKLTGIGLLIGIPVAFILNHAMASFIFGIVNLNLFILGGFSATLIIVAVLAAYIPARRAMRVDPLVALRYE